MRMMMRNGHLLLTALAINNSACGEGGRRGWTLLTLPLESSDWLVSPFDVASVTTKLSGMKNNYFHGDRLWPTRCFGRRCFRIKRQVMGPSAVCIAARYTGLSRGVPRGKFRPLRRIGAVHPWAIVPDVGGDGRVMVHDHAAWAPAPAHRSGRPPVPRPAASGADPARRGPVPPVRRHPGSAGSCSTGSTW